MRTVQFELLRPNELLEEKTRFSVVYLPVGPLEWHGPHLALGVDPLSAEAVSRRVAQETGGVVMPTFFWGTDSTRSPQMLRNLGFTGEESIVGMDFPDNAMQSLYAEMDAFSAAVREYLRLLVRQGYRLIVIVNGHGGENHVAALTGLAKEFTETSGSTVLYTMSAFIDESMQEDFGHATKVETSIMLYLHPECVDLDVLPPAGEKLRYTALAMVDESAFCGCPSPDFTVLNDPRDSSPALGREIVDISVRVISKMVQKAWAEITF